MNAGPAHRGGWAVREDQAGTARAASKPEDAHSRRLEAPEETGLLLEILDRQRHPTWDRSSSRGTHS